MFKFRSERLDEENPLGNSASGEVFPYQKSPEDLRWVVRRIFAKNVDQLISCLPKVVLGFACDHPCVLPVKGYFVEKIPSSKYFHVYMKIPRMRKTLLQHFEDRKADHVRFLETEIIRHFYSLVSGIKHLHQKKIFHGDIKHENLFLDEQENLKIGDVGIVQSPEEDDASFRQKGARFYSAPEILNEKFQKEQLSKADIWSLGVIILELCAFDHKLLNSSLPQDQLQDKISQLLAILEEEKYHQKELIDLIKKLLSIDPKERPDIDQIKVELEKNFGNSINKDLFSDWRKEENKDQIGEILSEKEEIATILKNFEAEKSQMKDIIAKLENDLGKIKKEKIAEKEQIAEILKNFEAEKIQMKDIIEKLESDLVQQKLHYEEIIKALTDANSKERNPQLSDEDCQRLQIQQENPVNSQIPTNFEEQIRMLYQSRLSPEDRSRELEKSIKASVKKQIEAYEKILQESQRKEKVPLPQENYQGSEFSGFFRNLRIFQFSSGFLPSFRIFRIFQNSFLFLYEIP